MRFEGLSKFREGVGSRDLAALMISCPTSYEKRCPGDYTQKLHPPHEHLLSK